MLMRRLTSILGVLITIGYVNGFKTTFPVSKWRYARGDGVDYVRACNPKCTIFQGNSVYWLYPEGKNWVVGGGPVGYGVIPPETILKPDGTQESRAIRFMPDLKLNQVKLGAWWPGTKNHPMGEKPK